MGKKVIRKFIKKEWNQKITIVNSNQVSIKKNQYA